MHRPGPKTPARLGLDALHYAYVLRIPRREAYFCAFSEWSLRYPERTGRPADKLEAFEVFLVEDGSPYSGEREPRNRRTSSPFQVSVSARDSVNIAAPRGATYSGAWSRLLPRRLAHGLLH
jgi:hypothetical protein